MSVGPGVSPFFKPALGTEKFSSKKEQTSNCQYFTFLNWHKEAFKNIQIPKSLP